VWAYSRGGVRLRWVSPVQASRLLSMGWRVRERRRSGLVVQVQCEGSDAGAGLNAAVAIEDLIGQCGRMERGKALGLLGMQASAVRVFDAAGRAGGRVEAAEAMRLLGCGYEAIGGERVVAVWPGVRVVDAEAERFEDGRSVLRMVGSGRRASEGRVVLGSFPATSGERVN
jgi:hypothetical protein